MWTDEKKKKIKQKDGGARLQHATEEMTRDKKWQRHAEEKQIKGKIIITIIIIEHACKQMQTDEKKTNGEARLQRATEERTRDKK